MIWWFWQVTFFAYVSSSEEEIIMLSVSPPPSQFLTSFHDYTTGGHPKAVLFNFLGSVIYMADMPTDKMVATI